MTTVEEVLGRPVQEVDRRAKRVAVHTFRPRRSWPAVITGLVIGVPGAQPLTIGCLDIVGSEFRFSWGVNAARPNERPAYVVSGGDWLTLVEAFGLTAQLHDSRG